MMEERRCTFCKEPIDERAGKTSRSRSYSCGLHAFHLMCKPDVCLAVCPVCNCAKCCMLLTIGDFRTYQPCGCNVHTKCTPLNKWGMSCPRCQARATALTDPDQVTALVAAAAAVPSSAPTTAATVSLPTLSLGSLFGGISAKRIFELGRDGGIQALKDARVTFADYAKTGARLDILVTWGAKRADLEAMGITRAHLLLPTFFNVNDYAKLGFTYGVLRSSYQIRWHDLRRFSLTFEQLKALAPSIFVLVDDGFGFDDLMVYRKTPVEEWAREPFCLRNSLWVLKPGKGAFDLDERRIDMLRVENDGNWTDEQLIALWPRGKMNNEDRALFGIPFDDEERELM